MTGEPGTLATRAQDESPAEPVFSPQDFKLNLRTRLELIGQTPADEAVSGDHQNNLDSPAIRKLTWEHVVPDRPASSASSAATLVPLPPPRRVPPPPWRSTRFVRRLRPTRIHRRSSVEDEVVDEEVVESEVDVDVDVDVDVASTTSWSMTRSTRKKSTVVQRRRL